MTASIVKTGDRLIPFLACSVPYLQSNPLGIHLEGSELKDDSNGGRVAVVVDIVDETIVY